MARLTKTEAARQLGISRTTLYKLIDQDRVSATPDGLIDETELVRAAPYVDTLKERSRTSMAQRMWTWI
jgi:excisionase family DNA binding protein